MPKNILYNILPIRSQLMECNYFFFFICLSRYFDIIYLGTINYVHKETSPRFVSVCLPRVCGLHDFISRLHSYWSTYVVDRRCSSCAKQHIIRPGGWLASPLFMGCTGNSWWPVISFVMPVVMSASSETSDTVPGIFRNRFHADRNWNETM